MTLAPWNSLEVTKLLVATLTPIVVAVVGFLIGRALKRVDQIQWHSQKLIERRLALFDQTAKDLNKLYCYFVFVGTWKEMNPPDVIALKRTLDGIMFVYTWLFSPKLLEAYTTLIDLCFDTYTGKGHDARLLTKTEQRKLAAGANWKPEWDVSFREDKAPDKKVVANAYNALMAQFAHELGVRR